MATVKSNPDCTRCVLHKTAQTVCLMGRGPIPSDVMFIGEAPGYREDEEGKPFQGDAGVILDDVCSALGFNFRKEAYTTNTVRCRPPNNKTPLKSQSDACSKWMRKEFRIVKPKFVLLLGKTAMRTCPAWAKVKKLGDVRGKSVTCEMPWGPVTFFSTFHPAACIPVRDKRGMNKAQFKTDIAAFLRLVKNISIEHKLNKRVVRDRESFEEFLVSLSKQKYISMDNETQYLNPWAKDRHVVLKGYGFENEQWIIPFYIDHTNYAKRSVFNTHEKRVAALDAIIYVIKKYNIKVICQNGKFDLKWDRIDLKNKHPLWLDVLPLSTVINENEPHNLTYMSMTYAGADNYDDLTIDQKAGYGISFKKHSTYLAYDVYYTRLLGMYFLEKLKQDKKLEKYFWNLNLPGFKLMVDVECNGEYVDMDQFKVASDLCRKQAGESLEVLDRFSSLTQYPEAFNWQSPNQVRELLFDKLDMPVLEKTKTGLPSTAESVLQRLAALPKKNSFKIEIDGNEYYKQEIAQSLLSYREAKKLSSFIDSWGEKMDDEHLLHPSYKVEVVTGRTSCVEPNLQQTPRNKTLRSCVSAPPGWDFIAADYSQIELRLVAMAANERNMMEVFNSGGDIHLVTASRASGKDFKDITEEERKKAKAINFGFIYCMYPKKFMIYSRDNYGVVVTEDEATLFREIFFEQYWGLPIWHRAVKKFVRKHGYVRNMWGRIRHLPSIFSSDRKEVMQAERQAINSPIQGAASELNIASATEIHETFDRNEVRVTGFVHDEIHMWVRKSVTSTLLPKIKSIMEKPKICETLGIEFTVPIIAEIKVGPWGKGQVWQAK